MMNFQNTYQSCLIDSSRKVENQLATLQKEFFNNEMKYLEKEKPLKCGEDMFFIFLYKDVARCSTPFKHCFELAYPI